MEKDSVPKLKGSEKELSHLKNHKKPEKENYDVKTFLEWASPGRPFKKRKKQYYLLALVILMLVETILFLFSEYTLMLVALALLFLSFTLASIPPRDFHYKISNQGIKVEDHFFIWEELYDFYFKRIEGVDVLFIRTQAFLPGELKLTLGSLSKDEVRKILVHFLPYREFVKPTFMEKSADWLSRNFPLE